MITESRRHFLRHLALGLGGGVVGLPLLTSLARAQGSTSRGPRLRSRTNWRLEVGGEVSRECLFDLDNIWMLPSRMVTAGLTSESGGASVATFEGVHISTFAALASAPRRARWVHVTCEDGHEDWFALGDLMRPQAIFVHTREDVSPMPEWGGVLRLIVPWRATNRHPAAISRIDFETSHPGDVDPLRLALDPLPSPVRGYRGRNEAVWTEASRAVEIPEQRPADLVDEEWFTWRTPWGEPDAGRVDWYASQLVNTSFVLANMARASLAKLGHTGASVLSPERDWSPDTNPLQSAHEATRVLAHNLLAEVDHPDATEWTRDGLADDSGLVRALCLDTLIRRGASDALAHSLTMVGDGDDGVALTALEGVSRLAPNGDATALTRLRMLRESGHDAVRTAMLDETIEKLSSP